MSYLPPMTHDEVRWELMRLMSKTKPKTEVRFPDDERLREHKFKIHERPKSGKNTWIRYGDVFSESKALAICESEEGEESGNK